MEKVKKYIYPNVYDIYNKQFRVGICGTITAHGNMTNTNCGTYFVFEVFYGTSRNKASDNKRLH